VVCRCVVHEACKSLVVACSALKGFIDKLFMIIFFCSVSHDQLLAVSFP
jgi:hypothetical protein